jgi:hypothetical protein
MAKKTETEKGVDRRAISLVRIEAAYGPIYLVIDTVSEFKPDTSSDRVVEFAKLAAESFGEPHIVFANVLAVVKGGLCCPTDIFTHIAGREVPLDFNFEKEVHRTAKGIFQWFPEARHS